MHTLSALHVARHRSQTLIIIIMCMKGRVKGLTAGKGVGGDSLSLLQSLE